MSDHDTAAGRLRLIDEALTQAMDLADVADEPLIGALVSAAQDAVLKRFEELGHP